MLGTSGDSKELDQTTKPMATHEGARTCVRPGWEHTRLSCGSSPALPYTQRHSQGAETLLGQGPGRAKGQRQGWTPPTCQAT